jgi:predicted ATPase/DNA-binding winged helix-turn-helix (wHTH) protein
VFTESGGVIGEYAHDVQVHDLGSLWVESGGLPLALKGRRMTAALSALLVDLGEKVRTEALIEAVWDDEPSPRVSAALDTLMWRLRRVLDPDRSVRAPSTVLRTEQHGYRLTISGESVDSRVLSEAAGLVAGSDGTLDPIAVLEVTASALALWRGRPYDDVDDNGWLPTTRARLSEQHLALEQGRVAALLEVGQPERAVAELVPLLAERPFAEQLWAQRILGLHRCGRSSAALEAYAEVRRLLERELGLDPGPDLQRLHQQVLRHDEALAGPSRARATRGIVRIPHHRTSLVGRSGDIHAVDELLQYHRLVSITGPVGCGKTRLAAATAQQLRPRFPDGIYFVDLSDVADGSAVAERVQETLGTEGDGVQTPTRTVTDFAAGRTALVVLDNCEQVLDAAAALAEALLDNTEARVLVTSRRLLGVSDEAVHALRPLELPSGTTTDDLVASPAVTLFVERVANQGIPVELCGPNGAQIARICHATDGLPLGIELAAARARTFQLQEIASDVADNPMSLVDLAGSRRRANGERTLHDSIDWSYSLLTGQAQRAHRRLSVLPPRFTVDAAVAVCAGEVLPAELVPNALIGLVGHSLLESGPPERPGGPSLFRQLVPIRAHAAGLLAQADEAEAASQALLGWVHATVGAGPRMGQSDGGRHDKWLDDNRRTITAALEAAIEAGPSDDDVITLCRLVPYWWLDGKLSPETVRLVAATVAAVGPENSDFAKAAATAAHGSFLTVTQQAPCVPGSLLDAVICLHQAPPELAVFAAELLLAVAAACWVGRDLATADAAADGVATYGELLDDIDLRVLARAVRCAMGLVVDPAAAAGSARSVLIECQEVGNSSAEIMCLHTLYMAALAAGDGPEGLRWSEQAIRVQQEIGQRNAAPTLEARGDLYLLAGRPLEAIRCFGSADLQYSRLGRTWPQIPGTDQLLAAVRQQVSAEEFDEAWSSGERLATTDLVGAWA